LTYTQIGILLSVPSIFGNLVEPAIGILGDVWKRRVLVLIGGVGFGLACLLTGLSHSFWPLLISLMLFNPSSGAFVTLSQATLMDTDPSRHDHNMARWTFAGSLGVVAGPLALGAALWLGATWRVLFFLFAALAVVLLLLASRFHFPNGASHADSEEDETPQTFMDGVRGAFRTLKRREVWRWLVLLQFMDLMLDVLYGYLALYLVDVGHITPAQAGIGVTVWTGFGLLGDFLLIHLLERVDGLAYLRISAIAEGILYPCFLLVPGLLPKFIILALLGMFNAGWYAVLQGRLYSSMPGQSGTVNTVSDFTGLIGALIPLAIGLVAERYGIGIAMWLLIAGPIALIIGLPRRAK